MGEPPRDLTATGAAVLSLLTFGEASGYELRSRADDTLRFFFAAPAMSQIYAELDRLDVAGLVASRDVKRPGTRPGRVWHLTAKGRRHLARWANDEPVPAPVYRDHLALRLMLGALVDPNRLVALVDERLVQVDAERADLQAVADAIDPADPDLAHAAVVAEWGLTTFAAERAGLERVRRRLEEGLPRADDAAAAARAVGP